MKNLSTAQTQILHLLSDGQCHSGSALGQVLQVSRAAIWKQINQLITLGIPISRLAQQGYQLPSAVVFLDEEEISQQLKVFDFTNPYRLHLFTVVDSTNRFLKDLPVSGMVDICLAELQTQGKGRFGRHWHSPFGENLYCSSRWHLHCDLSKLAGLSLVISLAIVATINQLAPCPELKIKWPNDILWRDKKLSGSLIEISGESHASCNLIIGIGLNVNTDTNNIHLEDKAWCSLLEIFASTWDRNLLAAKLIVTMQEHIQQFIHHGLEYYLADWQRYDYLAGKAINVNQASQTISGIAQGITPAGQLILQDDMGAMHYLSAGDTSIMSAKTY